MVLQLQHRTQYSLQSFANLAALQQPSPPLSPFTQPTSPSEQEEAGQSLKRPAPSGFYHDDDYSRRPSAPSPTEAVAALYQVHTLPPSSSQYAKLPCLTVAPTLPVCPHSAAAVCPRALGPLRVRHGPASKGRAPALQLWSLRATEEGPRVPHQEGARARGNRGGRVHADRLRRRAGGVARADRVVMRQHPDSTDSKPCT